MQILEGIIHLNLHSSSYPTRPHLEITKYFHFMPKTDPMDVSAWIRARVSADVSGRKQIFHFLFTATALLCGALLEKTNKFLGLKNLDSCSF